MKATVDVIMVMELNELLKNHHIEYSLHTVGGCSCCGLELKCEGKEISKNTILDIINDYLSHKWLVASFSLYDDSLLYIDSQFNMHQKKT